MNQCKHLLLLLIAWMYSCNPRVGSEPLSDIRYLFPKGKDVVISMSDFTAIRYASGVLLSLPPHCFEVAPGTGDSVRLVLSEGKEPSNGRDQWTYEIRAYQGSQELRMNKEAEMYVEFPAHGMIRNSLLRWERNSWTHYVKGTTHMIPFPLDVLQFHTTCNGHENYRGLREDLENTISHTNFYSAREFVNRYNANACQYEQVQVFSENLSKPLVVSDRILAEYHGKGAKTMIRADSLSVRYQMVLAEVYRYFASFELQQPWPFPSQKESASPEMAWDFFDQFKDKTKMMTLWVARQALLVHVRNSAGELEVHFFPAFVGAPGKYALERLPLVYISPGELIGAMQPFR